MIFLRLERLIINRMGKTMNIQFTDNSKEVLEAMQQAAARALEKCGLTHVHIKRYKYHYTRCAV